LSRTPKALLMMSITAKDDLRGSADDAEIGEQPA
jgi:hypothetical protein